MSPNRRSRMGRFQGAVLLCVLQLSTQPLWAQSPGDAAVLDSSRVAHDAWERGVRAFRANDVGVAHRELRHAALAWPVEQGYLWGRVISAAMMSDTAEVIAGLRGYSNIGLGRSVWSDTALRQFHAVPEFRILATRLDSNIAPLVRSHEVATMRDSTFWPEGVDFDPKSGNYYLASVRHRTIAELRPDGTVREMWPRASAGMGALMGIRVDTVRGVLWATMSGIAQMEGYAPADSALGALLRIRISDGSIERRWDIPPSPLGHVLGDLAVSASGDVFLTDSREPVLYRLRVGADTLERITNPLFRSLQGMAPSRDGAALYVADYAYGLLRVDLHDGSVVRLDDAPGSTSLGCDGIVLDPSGAIIAVQNGVSPARIMRFTIDDRARRITRAEVIDRNTLLADEPTIGTLAHGEFVYVANSQWEKYDERGTRKPAARLTGPLLLGVPLGRATSP
jgi:sugar lactone lactonase YvrE